jgi:predicted transposase/invertase (TIGR01784 family)
MRINIRQREPAMQTLINPQIDCVFKAILGSEENKALLIHFLNAVLVPTPDRKIISAALKNTFNDKEFSGDKTTIVDVMAQDQNEHCYQIEIQMQVSHDLSSRMAYTWSGLYRSQLRKGDSFTQLKPAISIWLLGDNLAVTKQSLAFHHCFALHDQLNKVTLTDHCQIHTLELKKSHNGDIRNDIDYWRWLFSQKEGVDVEHLPSIITGNPYMRQAMETIKRFTQEEKERHLYERQLVYQRVQADREIAQATLEAKYTSLEAEKSNLKAEKSNWETEKSNLKAEKSNWEAEKSNLKAENDSMQAALNKAQEKEKLLLLKLQQVEADSC